MTLGMAKCTNCAKYKLLLTWSAFHFRGWRWGRGGGTGGHPSIFICVKTTTAFCDLTPDIDSTNGESSLR